MPTENIKPAIDEEANNLALFDTFNGDNKHLISCIKSLLSLDEKGALVPHGVGGHARTLLSSAAQRLSDFDRVTHERDALQQRLTAADERADVLEGLLREAWEYDIGTPLKRKIMAALNPAEGADYRKSCEVARKGLSLDHCQSCDGRGVRVMGGEMTECPSCEGVGFKFVP